MITFSQFLDLCESSVSQSSVKRSLASKGPKKNKRSREEQRRSASDRAALRKAGFRGSPSKDKSPEETEVSSSPHHFTTVTTHKSQTDYAYDQGLKSKTLHSKGKVSVRPTAQRVQKLKQLRRQMGGNRTTKPVHDVSIESEEDYPKNDPRGLISRAKSFKREVRSVPHSLKAAGAKSGDKVTATPMALMRGEDPRKGREKRDKIYSKELGAKMNPKTGKTMGTMRG